MADKSIYTVGGTVQAGDGVYIPRKADEELLQYCRAGEFAFILSSRQVGKSSLMVRTSEQLESERIRSVIIDLSSIGVNISTNEWYLGILDEIANTLKLRTDIFSWWSERPGLSPATRMTNFFRDILLKEIGEPIVIFFDEIDSTLSIPFADDFFAALRAIYNARSTISDFKRLSFVMIGVATPSDLIADDKRTPFNIGHRVDLTDFTLEEASPLAGQLSKEALGWVIAWTGGHPYLTQMLCAYLSNRATEVTESTVEDAIKSLFDGEQGQHDNNLQFVRDMLTKRAPDIQRVLKTYKNIRSGKKVSDDERSIPKAHLKISGVVRRRHGQLLPRNRIYERAFDLTWIKENTPPTTGRRLVILSTFVAAVALMIAGYFAWLDYNRTPAERAAQYTSDFQTAENSRVRLKNLAELFRLSDDTHSRAARELFNGLSQQEQFELFRPDTSWGVNENQVIVVRGLYSHFDNTDVENQLLSTMKDTVKQKDPSLALEIAAWLEGREELNQARYDMAVSHLNIAIRENPSNPALYLDRAQGYIGLGEYYYSDALDDLLNMIRLDKNRGFDAYRLIKSNTSLDHYWTDHKNEEKFAELAEAITIPMVFIPAGDFIMGTTSEGVAWTYEQCQKQNSGSCPTDYTDQQPLHKVFLEAFYIDQFEVTNARYSECVAAGVCNAPSTNASNTRESYYDDMSFDNYPVINISWFDANTYCIWRGSRLPTEAEWEKAVRWMDHRIYPWGDTFDCSFANVNSCVGDTTEVGTYESDRSPYGAYDVAGNVSEWVADWYSPTYYVASPSNNPRGPEDGSCRAFRGGDFNTYPFASTATMRFSGGCTIVLNQMGLRCAMDASK